MAYTSAGPEAQADTDLEGDVDQHARIAELREQLHSDDVLEYLGYEREQISEVLRSTEQREELFERLMANQEMREKFFPGVEVLELRSNLDALGEYLELELEMQRAHENFLKDVQSPEKAGIFMRAFESVKGFAKRHPVVTTLLAAAAAVGGVYLAWNYLGGIIPVPNVMEGAAGVADSVAAPTGGAFEAIPQGDIVPPNMFPPSASGELPLPPAPTGTPVDFYPPGAPD